jgi:hypothetical protein
MSNIIKSNFAIFIRNVKGKWLVYIGVSKNHILASELNGKNLLKINSFFKKISEFTNFDFSKHRKEVDFKKELKIVSGKYLIDYNLRKDYYFDYLVGIEKPLNRIEAIELAWKMHRVCKKIQPKITMVIEMRSFIKKEKTNKNIFKISLQILAKKPFLYIMGKKELNKIIRQLENIEIDQNIQVSFLEEDSFLDNEFRVQNFVFLASGWLLEVKTKTNINEARLILNKLKQSCQKILLTYEEKTN